MTWEDPQRVVEHYGQRETGPSVFDFREPKLDWYGVALDHVDWTGADRTLDAGCGRGDYIPAIRRRAGDDIIGLDLTLELLRHTAVPDNPGARFVCGDVTALPFPDATFDRVLSMHMLYVVPDMRAVVAGFRRVLRPGGILLAATNSRDDKRELDDVFLEAGATHRLDDDVASTFTLENGADVLATSFADIQTHVNESVSLVIPDPAPVVAWYERWRETVEPMLEPGLRWDTFRHRLARTVQARIERDGAFIVRERLGLFVCR